MFVPPGLSDWVPGRPKTRFRSDAVSHIFSDVETSKLTTSPVLLFQSLYRLRTSKLTTTPVLLFRCLSGKERPSSLPHHTPCCCFNAIMAANVQAHNNHTSVAVSKPLPAANVQAHNHTSVAVSMPFRQRTSKLTTTPHTVLQSQRLMAANIKRSLFSFTTHIYTVNTFIAHHTLLFDYICILAIYSSTTNKSVFCFIS